MSVDDARARLVSFSALNDQDDDDGASAHAVTGRERSRARDLPPPPRSRLTGGGMREASDSDGPTPLAAGRDADTGDGGHRDSGLPTTWVQANVPIDEGVTVRCVVSPRAPYRAAQQPRC